MLVNFSCLQGGCLFKVGAYLRWALIRGWALNPINMVYIHVYALLIKGGSVKMAGY